MINTLGSLFSYEITNLFPYKFTKSVNCINNSSNEYINDLEYKELDNSSNSSPKVETMKRISSQNKISSVNDNNPTIVKNIKRISDQNNIYSPSFYYNRRKSSYYTPITEYKCYRCGQIVNMKYVGSFHAIDKMWCYQCWITKPWEMGNY